MTRQPASVWRLAVLWQDAVLDVVTVKKRRTVVELRTGERIHVRVIAADDGAAFVEVEGTFGTLAARDGELLALPAGHALLAHEDVPAPAIAGFRVSDSTLFHATMIGAAFQAVFVSALVLTPPSLEDAEAGAGLSSDMRRIMLAPGGTASTRGSPSFNQVGRRPDEAEKADPQRTRGTPPRMRGPRGQTVEQALEEMKRALHLGDGGAELKETLGELAQSVARAPELGAGVGGLAPRDPATNGAGNGLIGVGEARITERLRERIAEDANKPSKLAVRQERAPIGPVQLQDVPAGDVAIDPGFDLDPIVKDELMRAVRQRHNTIRHCYESWGLTADATRSGRLTLELTLLPNGRTESAKVTVDDAGLKTVAACVERMTSEWYLGDGLVDKPTRVAFPFVLKPRPNKAVLDFDER